MPNAADDRAAAEDHRPEKPGRCDGFHNEKKLREHGDKSLVRGRGRSKAINALKDPIRAKAAIASKKKHRKTARPRPTRLGEETIYKNTEPAAAVVTGGARGSDGGAGAEAVAAAGAGGKKKGMDECHRWEYE